MTEVSQNELTLITKNQQLELELREKTIQESSVRSYLAITMILLYIVSAVGFSAIIQSNKDQAKITQYEEYIDQQEVELQGYSHELFLLKNNRK